MRLSCNERASSVASKGACADLLVVDGDPLEDIGLLAESGRHLRLIMRGGELIRSDLK